MSKFDGIQIRLVGSSATSTFLPSSDLDIVILDISPLKTERNQNGLICQIFDLLCTASLESTNDRKSDEANYENSQDCSQFSIRDISFINASTPLITLTINGLKVDISMNNIHSISTVVLVEEIMRTLQFSISPSSSSTNHHRHIIKEALLLMKVFVLVECPVLLERVEGGGVVGDVRRGGFSSLSIFVMILCLFKVLSFPLSLLFQIHFLTSNFIKKMSHLFFI